MNTTTVSGIFRFLTRASFRSLAGFILVIILTAALIAAASPALAATVSVSASENNGPVSVTGNATFYNGETGSIRCYLDSGLVPIASDSGEGSASCSTIVDGAILTNGEHTVRAVATDSQGSAEATATFEVENPVSLTSSAPPLPQAPMDITGTAQFNARKNPTDTTGWVRIWRRSYGTTTWYLLRSSVGYQIPTVNYSCQDMDGGLVDVGDWVNGDWEIGTWAYAPNSTNISDIKVVTIQNPISVHLDNPVLTGGPINVTANAQFIARKDDVLFGRIRIYTRISGASTWTHLCVKNFYESMASFDLEADCGTLLDIATWANAVWEIRAVAETPNAGNKVDIKTITVDNTPKVTASCPRYVSGDFDITGTAQFTEVFGTTWKGRLYIVIDGKSLTGAAFKQYSKDAPADFSYAEMTGAPLNADTLGHGEHVANIIAQAYNGTYSPWLAVPFRTGPPEADGSGNLKIVTP